MPLASEFRGRLGEERPGGDEEGRNCSAARVNESQERELEKAARLQLAIAG